MNNQREDLIGVATLTALVLLALFPLSTLAGQDGVEVGFRLGLANVEGEIGTVIVVEGMAGSDEGRPWVEVGGRSRVLA